MNEKNPRSPKALGRLWIRVTHAIDGRYYLVDQYQNTYGGSFGSEADAWAWFDDDEIEENDDDS